LPDGLKIRFKKGYERRAKKNPPPRGRAAEENPVRDMARMD
jgi:hypothetical protein